MFRTTNKNIAIWLYTVSFLIIFLVMFGGWVRLTRSGLSMVEWHVITGVLPPIGETAWQETFEKYQQTPEFIKINRSMTLEEYKFIYYNEYLHRVIARLAGMLFVVPLFYYLFTGKIPWRKSHIYLMIGLGFAGQGFLGWYMVSSGLIDRPSVSHYRLTAHLLTALGLLGLTYWAILNNKYGFAEPADRNARKTPYKMTLFLFLVLLLQIAYGGLVAGLKAGHASNSWPLMFGKLIPPGLLSEMEPWWQNLLAYPPAVHYVHRWFAFTVLGMAIWLYYTVKNQGLPQTVSNGAKTMIWITITQIVLGISVIWFDVPVWLAIVHQGMAITLFLATIFINHRLWYE
ncbi:MAG: heme A synthase [Chloroflexi bacterium]|nr:heme A synthase [Chloroflexota bacterium]